MQKAQGFRHELKYGIDPFSYLVLRQRLSTVMRRDSHAGTDGRYQIVSLYFDNCCDKALRENRMGSTAGKSSGCAAIMMIARHFFWKKSRRSMGYA